MDGKRKKKRNNKKKGRILKEGVLGEQKRKKTLKF